jgi:hypothetical protein
MPAPYLLKKEEKKEDEEICLFGQTNFRNQMRRFGIKKDDRRRHMYIIGKTGMGKSTMMENMLLHDIYNGHGVGLVDPHGDFAEKIIDFIPSHRMNDVVYLNPSDIEHPVGFNILEVKNEEQKHLIAAGLMGTFKKIWPDVWSARMEYILNNTLLALLEYPGSTLLGINRLLSEKTFRKKVLRQVTDPVIKGFWHNEFENYEPRYQKEAVAPIQNKIGQFLSASVIRNMVAQVKSTVDIREAMDSGKILIMNLSKGRIGEDNSRLLGGMLITKIQLAAMERVDIPESERKDFFLYVDEFQNFATPSFANILSEARKYRLGLIMAHQYVAQLDEVVADAVFGNVGTIVSFRVGAGDAELLAKEFAPTFLEEDIVNLSKFSILLKLMIDGVASQPFSSGTLPPIGSPTGSKEKVIRVSRERYAKKRQVIEEKIMRWSGLEPGKDDEDVAPEARPEKKSRKRRDDNKPKKPETKKQDEKKQEIKKKIFLKKNTAPPPYTAPPAPAVISRKATRVKDSEEIVKKLPASPPSQSQSISLSALVDAPEVQKSTVSKQDDVVVDTAPVTSVSLSSLGDKSDEKKSHPVLDKALVEEKAEKQKKISSKSGVTTKSPQRERVSDSTNATRTKRKRTRRKKSTGDTDKSQRPPVVQQQKKQEKSTLPPDSPAPLQQNNVIRFD